nr:hypothetical protein GCM10025699_54560 [Microbacterium flavescens]
MTVSQHPAQPTDPRTVSELAEAVHAGLPTTIADLSSLVRIPSVSWEAFDPSHVAASADAVARLVEETGLFDEVRVSRAPIGSTGLTGQPAVLARREARDGKKTVLLYAHHDVQPQGDDADWDTPPFEPTLKGERLYGRGASDDKAGVMTHVAALRAVRDVIGDDLGVGVALFIEGRRSSARGRSPTSWPSTATSSRPTSSSSPTPTTGARRCPPSRSASGAT